MKRTWIEYLDRFIDINEQKFIAEARELFNEEVDIEREIEILTRLKVIGESIRFAKKRRMPMLIK